MLNATYSTSGMQIISKEYANMCTDYNRYKCILQLLGFGENCLALEEKSSEVEGVFTIDSKNMFKFNEIWSLCPELIAI